jgi:acetolactate synthase-1/3 small subunit
MHVKIDDVSAATLTVELADLPQQINLFLEMLRPFGIVEIARTGLIAVQKGAASMN